jgi:hypothetical protein
MQLTWFKRSKSKMEQLDQVAMMLMPFWTMPSMPTEEIRFNQLLDQM